MQTTAQIQELINKKADAKLKSDIKALDNVLCNGIGYQLLKDISVNVGTAENPKKVSLAWILSGSGLEDKIIETHTERYRKEETEAFLKQVEDLRAEVDNLLDSKNYD